jgi:type IV pilus assembly protein PilW
MSVPIHTPHRRAPTGARGYTIVELMVSILIGLFLVGGLVTLLVTNSVNSAELNKTGSQIENGRFAIQLLTDDIQHAGFLATYAPPSATNWLIPPMTTPLGTPISDCPATVAEIGLSINPVTLLVTAPVPLHGYDQTTATPTCTPVLDRLAGTDILVVQRVSTTGVPRASAGGGEVYFQTLNCANPSALPAFLISNSSNANTFNLTTRDCGANYESIWKYMIHIYFIDSTRTLNVAEMVAGSFVVTPLVEGIENMQIEYGLDTNNDSAPDCYVSNPDNVPNSEKLACPNAATYFAAATALKNWRNVMAVKVHILARNLDTTAAWTDNRQYDLGRGANALGPYNDHYKRHVYAATARLQNPAGLREIVP